MKQRYVGLALVAACAMAGCGQRDSAALPPATTARAATAPPQCQDQRTRPKYAQIKVKLKTRGDSFCVPEFGGFGGTIEYPGVKLSLIHI